jgi:hypothetical protein
MFPGVPNPVGTQRRREESTICVSFQSFQDPTRGVITIFLSASHASLSIQVT